MTGFTHFHVHLVGYKHVHEAYTHIQNTFTKKVIYLNCTMRLNDCSDTY